MYNLEDLPLSVCLNGMYMTFDSWRFGDGKRTAEDETWFDPAFFQTRIVVSFRIGFPAAPSVHHDSIFDFVKSKKELSIRQSVWDISGHPQVCWGMQLPRLFIHRKAFPLQKEDF